MQPVGSSAQVQRAGPLTTSLSPICCTFPKLCMKWNKSYGRGVDGQHEELSRGWAGRSGHHACSRQAAALRTPSMPLAGGAPPKPSCRLPEPHHAPSPLPTSPVPLVLQSPPLLPACCPLSAPAPPAARRSPQSTGGKARDAGAHGVSKSAGVGSRGGGWGLRRHRRDPAGVCCCCTHGPSAVSAPPHAPVQTPGRVALPAGQMAPASSAAARQRGASCSQTLQARGGPVGGESGRQHVGRSMHSWVGRRMQACLARSPR